MKNSGATNMQIEEFGYLSYAKSGFCKMKDSVDVLRKLRIRKKLNPQKEEL